MKNRLVIEIKDNKTIVTFSKMRNSNYDLLFHKRYESRFDITISSLYDFKIIDEIINDLTKDNMIDIINEVFLTINTSRIVFESYTLKYNSTDDLQEKKVDFRDKLENKYRDILVKNLIFTSEKINKNSNTLNVVATAELVEKSYLNDIKAKFREKGLNITDIIPITKIIENSTKTQTINKGIAFSILVEEKFTQLSIFENGKIISSIKLQFGLLNIYEHIAKMMDINIASAKKLFEKFGSIPPEDVVDDKIIHKREHGKEFEIFTKKDLSRYITEKVNQLFSNVKSKMSDFKINESSVGIVFSGEIQLLTGFKKYAAKSFAEPNIKQFKTNLIGANLENEFIIMGLLKEDSQLNSSNFYQKSVKTPKINFINKLIKMYNYI